MTRERMIGFLCSHQAYGGWNHPTRGWSPLAWNVKLHILDFSGKYPAHNTLDRLDDLWDKHTQKDWFYDNFIENLRLFTGVSNDAYETPISGGDGNLVFTFGGRSGGWLILSRWRGTDILKNIRSMDDWKEYLEDLPEGDLADLHDDVLEMDDDFSKSSIYEAARQLCNEMRHEWEAEILDAEKSDAAAKAYGFA